MNLDTKVVSVLKSRGSSTKTSPDSTLKTKVKINNDIFIMDSIKALSQEMHHHIKSSRLQSVNEKIHSIINGIHKEEKQQIKIAQESILDLDIVTGKSTKKYPKKRNMSYSNKKSKSKQKNNYKNLNTSMDTIQSQKVSFYERSMLNKNKKEYEIELLRNQMREELKEKFTEKPTLNSNTLKIAEARKTKPLYLRTQEVLMMKTTYLENLKQERNALEKLENSKIHDKNLSSQITENSKECLTSKERSDHFFNSQISWQKKINNRNKLAQIEKDNQHQIEESAMFKPAINKTSEILVSMKSINVEENDHGNLATYERLYNRHEEHLEKLKKKSEEPVSSFIPKINKNKLTYVKPKVFESDKANPINTIKPAKTRTKSAKLKENEKVKKMNSSTLENTSLSRIAEYSPNRVSGKATSSIETRPTMYLKRSSWKNKLDNANKRNNNKNSPRRKSKNNAQNSSDHLYKLNIRSGSAWDISNENVIKLNPKFKNMLETLLD
jgi:hypothetical protein